MQLLANKVFYKKDPYDDAQYQIGEFNLCFHKGNFHYSTTISFFSYAYNLAKDEYGMEAKEAFFSCYSHPKFNKRIIRSHPYIMDSIYIFQVLNWLSYFPREQILFIKGEGIFIILFIITQIILCFLLLFEEMYTDTLGVMERVTDFLGLCPFDWTPFVTEVHNKRATPYLQ